jgi:hypothetical protein
MEKTENGGIIMSETQYDRLTEQIAGIASDMSMIKERLLKYPDNIDMLQSHDKKIGLLEQSCSNMKENCAKIQNQKETKTVQPGAIKTGIIVGIVVGVFISLVNLAINYL